MAEIVNAPSKVLSQKAQEVKKVDSKILKIIEEMKQALLSVTDIIGVGLAAPQIGVSLRIFIMKPSEKSQIQTIINPKILQTWENTSKDKKKKKEKNFKLEGCLSLKDIWGTVERSQKVKISYLDEHGLEHVKTFAGFVATIVQHEIDHLEGILFPKKVLEQKGTLYKSHKNKKGEDVFDELDI